MNSLKNLVDFCKEFHISQSEMTFSAYHETVILHIPEGLVEDPDNCSDEFAEYLENKYNIFSIEGFWGFYT